LENGNSEEQFLVRSAIMQNTDLPEDVFEQILTAVQGSGALEYTQLAAKREADLALGNIKAFPKNAATDSLIALCEYSLARQM
jgi:octaprenyl-diphosphate synthase